MLPYPIEAIDENVLSNLIVNQVSERRDLEFKRDLPGKRDEEIKEFLADVTALANAQGGDLIFGVEEVNGIASQLSGLELSDVDGELLGWESRLRDCISPRLLGVRMNWITLQNGRGVMIIRVPASINSPHQAIFKNSRRFWSRNSRGKYEMDVHELRHAFTQSEQLPLKFKQLHGEAISAARGADMPFCVTPGPTAVLSIMPLGLFREERSLPVNREHALVPPLFGFGGYDSRETLEGVLINTPFQEKTGSVDSFAITHRTGRCDVAWKVGKKWTDVAGTEHLVVDHTAFEQGLKDCANSAQLKLQFLGVNGPWVTICSAIGMIDSILMLGGLHPTRNAYRDQALLKQTIIERIDDSALITFAESFYLLFGERRPNGKALAAR